jgi:hypothetical protein
VEWRGHAAFIRISLYDSAGYLLKSIRNFSRMIRKISVTVTIGNIEVNWFYDTILNAEVYAASI